MKLLEYEAKTILRTYHIPIPDSLVITKKFTPELTLPVVLKSQVPVGGRGKAGGVVKITKPEDITPTIDTIFKLDIKGFKPQAILAEQAIKINKEFYLSLLINRDASTVQIIAHKNGGVEVEDNEKNSFLIITVDNTFNSNVIGEQLAEYYDIPGQAFVLHDLIKNLHDCFSKNDATLIEINPLILTDTEKLLAGDCKMECDDAAAFRHPEWSFEKAPQDANFVELNKGGTVATIANGAGLAMATVDAVSAAGLSPANFLDIGGGANTESVLNAFEKIMEFPNVKAIVINIFAGITRCDEVAKAVIAAKSKIVNLPPLYIRLAGTNFEQAVEILASEEIPTLATLNECIATAKEVAHE